MARILILTVGSRGDVQPYVALGRGLQAAGHAVTLATSEDFEGFVTGHGLAYARLRASFMQLLETDEGRAAFSGGSKLGLMKKVMPMLRNILDDAWDAAQGAEALVYHPKPLAGYHLAERLRIPAFVALPAPILTPTREFINPVLPQNLRLGGWFNRLSFAALTPLMTMPYRGLINTWRREKLGLPPRPALASEMVRDGRPVPVLYAFSPSVVPVPADWDPAVVATGFWFLDEGGQWQPPAALQRFLVSGPPPVYVGFGSMVGRDPAASARLAVAALQQAGVRGVLAAGAGGLAPADLPETVYALDSAPHAWLFPRMAAVVHHGGAGTTAAGLRAGRPTVVCPFFGDQGFWGHRVHALGAGPRPLPQKALSAEALAQAIRAAATDPALRAAAEKLGQQIRAEDGVARAVSVVERALQMENVHVPH